MPIEPGWEISKDRIKDYNFFRARRFEPFESPILTTKMKRSKSGEGFAVLTDKKLYYRKKSSAAVEALSIFGSASTNDWEDKIPLQHIVRIEYQERGKYLLHWLKVDKHGNPKVDKRGNYKTYKAAFRVVQNKDEEEFKYLERREQFGYFLQKAIDQLKEKIEGRIT
jgi:hypothetical protein